MPKKSSSKLKGEAQLQAAFFEYLTLKYPDVREVSFSVPNGVNASPVTRNILKATGRTAGIPDVFISVPNSTCHGLYIEFKHGSGKLSGIQFEKIELLRERGYMCAIPYSIDEAIAALEGYLSA